MIFSSDELCVATVLIEVFLVVVGSRKYEVRFSPNGSDAPTVTSILGESHLVVSYPHIGVLLHQLASSSSSIPPTQEMATYPSE
jgi:hypothetical protein